MKIKVKYGNRFVWVDVAYPDCRKRSRFWVENHSYYLHGRNYEDYRCGTREDEGHCPDDCLLKKK